MNAETLIAARILQGIGAALLTPGSLAMIQGAIRPRDRAKAIGSWSGFGGIAIAIGPFVGGWLIEFASWRWIFLLNLPLAVVTLAVSKRFVPETSNPDAFRGFDVTGAVLGSLALGGVTFALIQYDSMDKTLVYASALIGVLAAIGFVIAEERMQHPMMDTSLFRSRQFSAANSMTLLVYAALGGMSFFLTLQLQTVLGYSPLEAGVATLPITMIMFFLAKRGGALATRIGPRLPMALGPLVCAVGIALISQVGVGSSYWFNILPGVVIFGLGLALLVAPLTATVLASAPDRNAGIASGINNAVARAGSLLAVAALPAVVGLSGADYDRPVSFSQGFEQAMWICSFLLAGGAIVSWLLIRNPDQETFPAPAALAQD
jgi:MFS family permease